MSTLYWLAIHVKLNRIINTFSNNWLHVDLYINSIRICVCPCVRVSGFNHTAGHETRRHPNEVRPPS